MPMLPFLSCRAGRREVLPVLPDLTAEQALLIYFPKQSELVDWRIRSIEWCPSKLVRAGRLRVELAL
jgi:hypothetical protein